MGNLAEDKICSILVAMEAPAKAPEDQNTPKFSANRKSALVVAVLALVLGTAVFLFEPDLKNWLGRVSPGPASPSAKVEIKKFTSEQEFKEYIVKSSQSLANVSFGRGVGTQMELLVPQTAPSLDTGISAKTPEDAASSVQRSSETNVQVKGIDEPDIVKTDGKNIYYSSLGGIFYPLRGEGISAPVVDSAEPSRIAPDQPVSSTITKPAMPSTIYPVPPINAGNTKVITAFPPEDLKEQGKIDKNGELLLKDNLLTVFSGNGIFSYDITDAASPSAKWQISLDNNARVVTSRLYQGKLYLITATYINRNRPCPLQPLTLPNGPVAISCTDIYYPVINTQADTTYTASKIDFATGNLERSFTFVGSSSQSVVYMSPEALFITYAFYPDQAKFLLQFYSEKGQDLLPNEVISKLDRLGNMDISDQAKLTEINVIYNDYLATLSENEQMKLETEIQNRLKDFTRDHIRELSGSGIVKADLDDFGIKANGTVPGQLLNQFSLDEYRGNLRLATTISGMMGGDSSVNDVYVLDGDLRISGAAKDLGKGERIFAVRFIDDKGYVVTFKQTDPFYVLDLGNPRNPQVKGELKIPGFSSYLDPLEKNKILGVGREGVQVKLSLFDVSSPENPTETAKYNLDEYWTEVSYNHHAFLKDEEHKIFFIPGGKGGYIFSYADNKLVLKQTVAAVSVKRAIYINNYLYIISDNKIVVLDEKDWTTVKSLSF